MTMTFESYHDIDGETVGYEQLENGDEFAMRVSWYDWTDDKPVRFTVTRELSESTKRTIKESEYSAMGSIKAEGSDGHMYKLYIDNAHIECLTDDKDGYDRGTKASKPKLINE